MKLHVNSTDFISFRCLRNGLSSTDTCQQTCNSRVPFTLRLTILAAGPGDGRGGCAAPTTTGGGGAEDDEDDDGPGITTGVAEFDPWLV